MFNDKSSFYWCWCFMQKQICDIYWWNCQQTCSHEHNLKFCHRQHQWQQWRIQFRKSIRSEKLKVFERNRIRKLFKNLRKRIRQFENFFFQKISRFVIVKLVFFNKINFIVVNDRQLNWKVKINIQNEFVEATLLIDIEVSAQFFVKRFFVKRNKLFFVLLKKSIQFQFADEFLELNITHMIMINILFEKHRKNFWCLITNIFNHDIILKKFWLKQHDFFIDHINRIMIFNFEFCCFNCNSNFTFVTIKNSSFKFKKKRKNKFRENNFIDFLQFHQNADITQISIYIFFKMTRKKQNSVVAL